MSMSMSMSMCVSVSVSGGVIVSVSEFDLGFLLHRCYSCKRILALWFRIVFPCLHSPLTILVLSAFFPLLCLSALLQLLPSQFVYLAPFTPLFELRTVIVTLLLGGGVTLFQLLSCSFLFLNRPHQVVAQGIMILQYPVLLLLSPLRRYPLILFLSVPH